MQVEQQLPRTDANFKTEKFSQEIYAQNPLSDAPQEAVTSPSLRSFPLEGHAPASHLPPLSKVLPNIIGANPYPHIRNASDFGSIGSIGELSAAGEENVRSLIHSHNHHSRDFNDTTQSLSLTVCKKCQEVLLGAFEHCLNKHGEPIPLLSTHHIDEEADGKIQVEAPIFDIVKDPTLSQPKKPAFDDPHEKVERDRWVQLQAKNKTAKLDITQPKVKGLGVKPGKAFSGAIYKRMLEAKDKEINMLRAQLYDVTRREVAESETVKKLKRALNQSVNYYTFAEEWQQNESSRLQVDIRHLKSELSSLMAFLINSEVEKQSLVLEMKELRDTIAGRERDAAKAIQHADEMKLKLQDSFKEFIKMDEAMALLRKEAVKGSEAVEMRNNMLQKNLTKLTTDFEASNRELKISSNKNRELEYELEQMVIDLNVKGEGLAKANQLASTLKENLDKTSQDLKELHQIYEHLILQKSKVEADGRAEIAKGEQIRAELRKALEKTGADLDKMTTMKLDLDVIVKAQKGDIENHKKNIVTLTGDRDRLSMLLEETQITAKRETSRRDDKINDLSNKLSKTEATLKTVSERREQLMFEVTDLQNALDTETNNAAKYLEELNNTKKVLDDKTVTMSEQIEKLTSSKQILNNDKKELTEKIKSLRQQVQLKQEELESNDKGWDEKYTKQSDTLSTTEASLNKLTDQHDHLMTEHRVLLEKYTESVKDNIQYRQNLEIMTKKHKDTDIDLVAARNTISSLLKDKTGLQWDLANAKHIHEQLIIKYNVETNSSQLAAETHAKYKVRTEELISDREGEIQRHIDELLLLRKENRTYRDNKYEMENVISELEGRLVDTIKALNKEIDTKEMLEVKLSENRTQFQSEKRMRAELERVSVKLRYVETFREGSHVEYWKTRDRKLIGVTQGLTSEAKRLNDLVHLLPSDDKEGFGNDTVFHWPQDIPLPKKKS